MEHSILETHLGYEEETRTRVRTRAKSLVPKVSASSVLYYLSHCRCPDSATHTEVPTLPRSTVQMNLDCILFSIG